jgi:type III secretory pathway component EscS
MTERRLPPVAETAAVSLALIIVGGIVMASQLPHRPALGVPIVLLVLSACLLVAAGLMVGSIDDFSRESFHTVGKWALLAYALIAGMIEYSFVRNHTSGAPLVVLTLMLVVFALNVSLQLAFGVARYQAT